MIVPLLEADHRCGAKALGLRRLIEAGFAVPPGVVVDLAEGGEDAVVAALPSVGPGPYAVRSSAGQEDGTDASFAGQLDSVLNVSEAEVGAAVRRVADSGRSASAYTDALGHRPPGRVPVIVQAMLDPVVAGVAFSRHPVTGAEQVVIEAVGGLGDSVTDGRSTPSRWVVEAGVTFTPAGSGLLTRTQLSEIADATRRIETVMGQPSDIEWAVTSTGLWMLQARPITVLPDRDSGPSVNPTSVLVTGTPAGPGVATGRARPIAGPDEFDRFRPGEVLVCRTTSPAWTPLLAHAAAVVTETGGILAHAAIVAREFGIPAVVAAGGASEVLRPGLQVVVDGDTGVVTEGGPR